MILTQNALFLPQVFPTLPTWNLRQSCFWGCGKFEMKCAMWEQVRDLISPADYVVTSRRRKPHSKATSLVWVWQLVSQFWYGLSLASFPRLGMCLLAVDAQLGNRLPHLGPVGIAALPTFLTNFQLKHHRERTGHWCFRLLLASKLLFFHWPKQEAQPRPGF